MVKLGLAGSAKRQLISVYFFMREDLNYKKTQMVIRAKWQEDPIDRKTKVTRKPNWQEDQSDKKTQVARRPKWHHPNDKKS